MLEIVTFGDGLLERPAGKVTEFDEELAGFIREMFETMRHGNGIGLAAPQVGVSKRIFVTAVEGDDPRVFVNPEIVSTSPELSEYEEGCLSFPGLYFTVKRPARVGIQAFDGSGRPFTLEAGGLLARVILHENDHLDGKLFIDRVSPFKRERALTHYRKLLKM